MGQTPSQPLHQRQGRPFQKYPLPFQRLPLHPPHLELHLNRQEGFHLAQRIIKPRTSTEEAFNKSIGCWQCKVGMTVQCKRQEKTPIANKLL